MLELIHHGDWTDKKLQQLETRNQPGILQDHQLPEQSVSRNYNCDNVDIIAVMHINCILQILISWIEYYSKRSSHV